MWLKCKIKDVGGIRHVLRVSAAATGYLTLPLLHLTWVKDFTYAYTYLSEIVKKERSKGKTLSLERKYCLGQGGRTGWGIPSFFLGLIMKKCVFNKTTVSQGLQQLFGTVTWDLRV